MPHWDDAKAMPYVEKSYVKYHMTIDIPDVKCDKVRNAYGHYACVLSWWVSQ